MSAYGGDDVQEKLYNLDQEERRILEELQEMDDADHNTRTNASKKSAGTNPRGALNGLLAECEKEVRNAKGFIKATGPPLQIARCKPGASGSTPKHATFLSRPKDTGVDFTLPVTVPEYTKVIKSPIFLNNIRDKCKSIAYRSADEYLDDMRLLARNTAVFNKTPDLTWVVQHANLLLEAAEEAVKTRRSELQLIEIAIRQADAASAAAAAATANPSKRKRSLQSSGTEPILQSSIQAISAGSRVSVLWPDDQEWYTAKVLKKTSANRFEVEYDDDGTRQIVDVRSDKWRSLDPPMSAPPVTGSGGRGRRGDTSGSNKRHKSGTPQATNVAATQGSLALPAGVVSRADLDDLTEYWNTKVDAVRLSLLEEIHARFDKLEDALNRSDTMKRVLYAVQDLADSVGANMDELRSAVAEVANRIPEEKATLSVLGQAVLPTDVGHRGSRPNDVEDTPNRGSAAEKDADRAGAPPMESASGERQNPKGNERTPASVEVHDIKGPGFAQTDAPESLDARTSQTLHDDDDEGARAVIRHSESESDTAKGSKAVKELATDGSKEGQHSGGSTPSMANGNAHAEEEQSRHSANPDESIEKGIQPNDANVAGESPAVRQSTPKNDGREHPHPRSSRDPSSDKSPETKREYFGTGMKDDVGAKLSSPSAKDSTRGDRSNESDESDVNPANAHVSHTATQRIHDDANGNVAVRDADKDNSDTERPTGLRDDASHDRVNPSPSKHARHEVSSSGSSAEAMDEDD